jgi:putative transposase
MGLLKQHEAGVSVPELAREHNVSTATIYQWRAKYGGMDASMMKGLKELEAENARLKKMYAEERIIAEIRKEALEGKLSSYLKVERWLDKPFRSMRYRSGSPVVVWASVRPATATRANSLPRMLCALVSVICIFATSRATNGITSASTG